MAHDNCDHCGEDYDFSRERDQLVLFIAQPWCNHVRAKCPHCGETTRIYLLPDSILGVLELKLPLAIASEAPEDVQELAEALWANEGGDVWPFKNRNQPKPDKPKTGLPEAPRDWLKQLMDDLREFGSCRKCRRISCTCS